MVKRFVLFVHERFYPSGGWKDFNSSYDHPQDAISAGIQAVAVNIHGNGAKKDFHVVDLISGDILFEN